MSNFQRSGRQVPGDKVAHRGQEGRGRSGESMSQRRLSFKANRLKSAKKDGASITPSTSVNFLNGMAGMSLNISEMKTH